jgi:hypothetical protein
MVFTPCLSESAGANFRLLRTNPDTPGGLCRLYINFFGSIDVDIEGELAQLGPTGYRPLRVRDTLF